jgi:hypothetical protein
VVELARGREAAHRERLATYEQIEAALSLEGRPRGTSARRSGSAWPTSGRPVEFWAGVAAEWGSGSSDGKPTKVR